MKPRIVCAAIKNKRSGLIICGARHFDNIMVGQIKALGQKGDWHDAYQGFIDQRGNFLDRTEAYHIAEREDQILRTFPEKETLFSENLY